MYTKAKFLLPLPQTNFGRGRLRLGRTRVDPALRPACAAIVHLSISVPIAVVMSRRFAFAIRSGLDRTSSPVPMMLHTVSLCPSM